MNIITLDVSPELAERDRCRPLTLDSTHQKLHCCLSFTYSATTTESFPAPFETFPAIHSESEDSHPQKKKREKLQGIV